MNAPLDIDEGHYGIQTQRQEHSLASIEAICDEEVQRVDLERVKTLISSYERMRDFCLDQSDKCSTVDLELRSKARIYHQVAADLRQVIR